MANTNSAAAAIPAIATAACPRTLMRIKPVSKGNSCRMLRNGVDAWISVKVIKLAPKESQPALPLPIKSNSAAAITSGPRVLNNAQSNAAYA